MNEFVQLDSFSMQNLLAITFWDSPSRSRWNTFYEKYLENIFLLVSSPADLYVALVFLNLLAFVFGIKLA